MNYVAGALIVAALLLVFLWSLRKRERGSDAPVHEQLDRFNVLALSRLLSGGEQLFLRSHVGSARSYRRLHRQRMRLSLRYLGRLSDILREVPAGEDLRALKTSIVRLRWMAISSYCFPSQPISSGELIDLAYAVQLRCSLSMSHLKTRSVTQ